MARFPGLLRRAGAALIGAALAGLGTSTAQDGPPRLSVAERQSPISVDGRLDEWLVREADLVLDRPDQVWSQRRDPSMRWLGVDDLSAEFWVAYDLAHFYVAGRVRDDSLVPGRVGGEWHNGDAIELFFDLGDRGSASPVGEFDADVSQLFLMPFSQERSWGLMDWRQRPAVPSGASLTGVRAVFAADPDDPGRYLFEAVIPLHNFPRIRGRRTIGFGVAIDDHDEGRAGRYQYMTWSGEQLVDARERLGEIEFTGSPPMSDSADGRDGAYGWISDNLRHFVLPLLGALAIGLLLWGIGAMSRRFPLVRPVGRAVGVGMFVLGFLLPGWLETARLTEDGERVTRGIEVLQTEVPRMEGGLLGGYRGSERDRVLVDLLAGRSIAREQNYRYTFHAAATPGDTVIGVGTRAMPGLGFDVRPYAIPLPLDRLELFGFREPLPPGRLNVVVARPASIGPTEFQIVDPDPSLDDVVVLEMVAYGPNGVTTGSALEIPGPFVPSTDAQFERMEVSYRTLILDRPLESLGIACRQGDGVRLLGLTWVSPEGASPRQDPLFLGGDTIDGVPTDLRGPHPRTAGVELRENGGTAAFPLPAGAAEEFRKLWLVYHGVYRTRLADPLGIGSHVCELTVEFAEEGVAPLVVAFQHQQTMFFGQDRANRELPRDRVVRVAQRWEGEDGEARVDFLREIDLPAGARPVSLRLRNTGPYAIRFRSAIFGTEVPNVATSTADSPLVRREGGEGLAPEILERLAGLEVLIYRNGRLSASTLPTALQQDRIALPEAARRVMPNDSLFERVARVGDGVVHEAYAVLRGEAWSGTVVAVLAGDPEHGEFVRGVNRIGAALWLGALPVLLLMFSEILAILNNLRLRLVSVLAVATLLPLGVLSIVLLQVIEGDHEARTRERVQQAVVSVEKQLADEKRQLLVNAQSWLADLVGVVRERGLLGRAELAAGLSEVLAPIMQSQMPPSWGQSGYLLFEFNPPPEAGTGGPVSVHVGGDTLRNLDTQLRTEVGVYLAWSVPLIGVRCSLELAGGQGVCALSVARQLDGAFLSALRRDRATILCDSRGYPVEAAGSEAIDAGDLVRHGQRPGVQARREELLRTLVPAKQPIVERHGAGDQAWIAGYVPLLDLQDTPRLLLGVLDEDTAATLPLAIGRVPVRTFFGGAAGLILVLSLFLSFVVASRISRPIERLEQGAQRLGRGELDVRVETDEGGQIGRLTRSFNQMAAELRARIQDLRLLNRGIQELTSKLELHEVVASAVAFYTRHSPADAVRICLGSRDAERIEVVGNEVPRLLAEHPSIRVLVEAVGPFSCRVGEEFLRLPKPLLRYRSAVGFPLVVGGRSRGAMLLLFEAARTREVDLDLLWTMAAQTASAVENARLYQVAVEDVRTGALRRDYFLMRVADEVARAEAERRPLCLLALRPAGPELSAAALGPGASARVVERLVALVRETLSRDVLVCRSAALELQVLLRADRAQGEAALQVLTEAVGTHLADLVADRAGGAAFDVRLAAYPEDGASAEFLFAALDARFARLGDLPLRVGRDPGAGLALSSPAMAGVLRTIERVAPTDISILVLGETGTGKEVLADLIHRWSRRAKGPLIKVHCAALSESLLASELFGHEKGAFTGAVERKLGRFEQAQGGTIFLDEIGEISLEVQVKLLRVLQEREIDRVGGTQPVPVDVRVIAATNRELEAMVRDGRFREDLYYRLQGMLVRVPPLRERKEEIPALLELFRGEAVAAGHTQVEGFTAEAMDELFRRDWPGNVRELRNTVLRAMVLATGPRVTRGDVLGIESAEPPSPPPAPVEPAPDAPPGAAPAAGAAAAPGSGTAAPGVGALDPLGGAAAPHLGERLRELLAWVAARGEVSSQEYAEQAGISPRTAVRDLGRMTEEGLLLRVGRRRGARYRLADGGWRNGE
jgi:DNA-binding NtrC family response regulator/HAMP domain-containing protein/GGDEF domain-containing protein